MEYFDEKTISGNIKLIRNTDGELFIKKSISKEYVEIYTRLKTLQNKNVVGIYDILPDKNGQYAVIEEFADGVSIYDAAQKRSFSPEEIRLFAAEICSGVSALHSLGIIHRDITYNNVIITKYGEIKLLDFDISRLYKKDSKADTVIMGTPGFAAPEQYGFLQSGETADIYAVGALMAFMLEHCDGAAKGSELSYIAQKCMKFQPELRYKSADSLRKAILSADKRHSTKIGNLAKISYYVIIFLTFVPPVFSSDSINKPLFLLEAFGIYIFPVMLFSNEWDWQKHFPKLKYARKPIKYITLSLIYFLVIMCIIILEAIRWSNR